MVKIKYNGDVTPCKIKSKGAVLFWTKGEIKELSPVVAKSLLENPAFKLMEGKIEEEKEEVEESVDELDEDFDLNDDGVVDGKDASLAGKVLASKKKK